MLSLNPSLVLVRIHFMTVPSDIMYLIVLDTIRAACGKSLLALQSSSNRELAVSLASK